MPYFAYVLLNTEGKGLLANFISSLVKQRLCWSAASLPGWNCEVLRGAPRVGGR